MDDIRLKITEAARMAGVSASTLRLWESQGLIEPLRSATGQRLFDRTLMDRLKTIGWLRTEKGLNPAAIREVLKDESEPALPVETQAVPVEGGPAPAIGAKIRHLRRQAGRTLQSVADETGIALSLLSSFERISQGLSLPALHALAACFGTTLAALSGQEGGEHRQSLVRAGQWTAWPATASGVTIQPLAEGRHQMECHRFVLAPGASSEGAYRHEGEEFMHILQGRMQIVLDGDQFFDLAAGDSFTFESTRFHAWRNLHEAETVLIWINTPATF
ncbi:MerR family transcriptional regulator [Rhizobium sp. 9140]|uniref:MerR family transcriptional regulator n=1 Tax=Rhizobium sp. 9140 TaxID=1761900 RepID=UPI0007953696|nr:MerR family transcriptional regulator [Rhizobium sp. 9140]CZT33367.1 DNA-binding transcriptional regulator, MerR family [Rhizobium sp. 9140]